MKRMRCLLRGGLGWAARVAAGVLLALLAVLAGFVWWDDAQRSDGHALSHGGKRG